MASATTDRFAANIPLPQKRKMKILNEMGIKGSGGNRMPYPNFGGGTRFEGDVPEFYTMRELPPTEAERVPGTPFSLRYLGGRTR